MKKLVSIVLSSLLVLAFATTAFAATPTEAWTGATVDGNVITAPAGEEGGAYTMQHKGEAITEEGKTYEVIVDLSEDYENGELFQLSLGVQKDGADAVADELWVMTQKTDAGFVLSSPAGTMTIADPGVYTYQWTVTKNETKADITFGVAEVGTLETVTTTADADQIRYIWAFGRDVTGNSGYVLDRDLVMYVEKPHVHDMEEVSYDPTCEEPGVNGLWYCEGCDGIFVDEAGTINFEDLTVEEIEALFEDGTLIPATGHNYKDGVCTECGAEDPDYQAPAVGDKEDPKKDEPKQDVDKTDADKNDSKAPKTGDETNTAMYLVLLATALGAAGCTVAYNRKNK